MMVIFSKPTSRGTPVEPHSCSYFMPEQLRSAAQRQAAEPHNLRAGEKEEGEAPPPESGCACRLSQTKQVIDT